MDTADATGPRLDSIVPHFTVADVVKTAEYYRDALGFQIAGYWDGEQVHHDPDSTAVFGIVQRDHTRLHFNRADKPEGTRIRATGAYDIYFHVTGVDALAREFDKSGVTIIDGPDDREYGQREVIVEDCNGLILAFGEEISAHSP